MSNLPSQPPADATHDPLASLHKMSRTAGLGSQEYVAVSATAVAALLLGLASCLAVLGTLLLIIPAAAIIVAVLAIRQINHSAGTQTGKGLALLGLILAMAFVALLGGREALHIRQIRREQGQIIALIEQVGKDLNRADYDAAWQQFGLRFQQRVKKEDFVNLWTQIQASPLYGPIKSMRWNGILDVQVEGGVMLARGVILVELADGKTDRRGAVFRKSQDDRWLIDDLEGYFDAVMAKSK